MRQRKQRTAPVASGSISSRAVAPSVAAGMHALRVSEAHPNGVAVACYEVVP